MHANTVVLGQAEQAIDNFKPWITIRPVNAGNLHQLLIGAFVAQLDHAFDKRVTVDVHRDFAIGFLNGYQIGAERLGDGCNRAIRRVNKGRGMAHRSIVPTRRILR